MSPGLDERQRALVSRWLPDLHVVHEHSWGLTDTVVLEVESGGSRYCVKAGSAANHHLVRELRAHQEWLAPWTVGNRAPRLRHADEQARVLVTDWLPGHLVQGDAAEGLPDTYRQAGALLAQLHAQAAVVDTEFEAREKVRVLAWLDRPHRIDHDAERAVRRLIDEWPCPDTVLVPTHGDWQPRNWLVDGGVVRVIDFGRAELRPALTDWSRLAVQQFAGDPSLEDAFVEGYGSDPREPGAWRRQQLREAVTTTAWAHMVGDLEFEAQGQRMLGAALASEPSSSLEGT